MEDFPHKELKTIEQLDEFINFITDNKISFMSNSVRPSMSPEVQQLYASYNQALQSVNVNHAASLYANMLGKAPNFVAARYNLAQIIKKRGDVEEALRQYLIAARYNSADPSIFIEIGVIFSEQGKKSEAIETYQHVLKLISDSEVSSGKLHARWLAILNVGVIYREIQDFEKSLEWLQMALNWINKHNKFLPFEGAWDSELVATYFEIGCLCKDIGDMANSEKWFLLGMEIAEKSESFDYELRTDETFIWLTLGQVYLETQNWNEAEYYFKKCLQRDPNNQLFQFMLEKAEDKNFRH